ncbi:MAG TPA: sulfotransferase [Ilumatobacter sp.]|nr:sulfotransferase [Ilumatobacter sp.]
MTASPILVTGSHRSGTTWAGAILSLSGEALSIHEPFNPAYPRSWLRRPPTRWFEYVDREHDDGWRAQMADIVALRPPVTHLLRRSQRPRHLMRVAQEAAGAARGRRRGARALVKDPIAVFSAPWIADRMMTDVVVLVRHPAAFASSLKRLDWRFDFRNLLDQPTLMDTVLAPHADDILDATRRELDIIDTSILLWRVINSVVVSYREQHPDWHIVRYEDLAVDPLVSYERLYSALGLMWTPAVETAVREYTKEGNVRTVADFDKGGVVRDSKAAMWTWTQRLTDDEIERVRAGTADVADHFYEAADWLLPHG